MLMEDNFKKIDLEDDYKEVALGICFGSGAGIICGAILNNVGFGLSAGGVLGILIGCIVRTIRKLKIR